VPGHRRAPEFHDDPRHVARFRAFWLSAASSPHFCGARAVRQGAHRWQGKHRMRAIEFRAWREARCQHRRASAATIDPHEAAHFGASRRGLVGPAWVESAMLHRLNPVRLCVHPRRRSTRHWHVEAGASAMPLAGRSRDRCRLRRRACSPNRWRAWVREGDGASMRRPRMSPRRRVMRRAMGLSISYFAMSNWRDAGRLRPSTSSPRWKSIEHVTDPAAFVGRTRGARSRPAG
jgi:hypothetical protein